MLPIQLAEVIRDIQETKGPGGGPVMHAIVSHYECECSPCQLTQGKKLDICILRRMDSFPDSYMHYCSVLCVSFVLSPSLCLNSEGLARTLNDWNPHDRGLKLSVDVGRKPPMKMRELDG